MDELGEADYPSYGLLKEIIVWEDEKFLVVNVLQTSSFNYQCMAYEVTPTDRNCVVLFSNLAWSGVLNIVKREGKTFIVEKCSTAVEDII